MMKFFAKLRSWSRAMTRRPRLDREMQAELQFHLDSYAADLVRAGLSPEEALRRARLELGSVEVQKENCRESLGLRLWDDLFADLRYGLRMLKKSPGFTAIAVTSLALGIGANTVIFTLAKEALLDTLAVPHPGQLRLLAVDRDRNSVIEKMWGEFHDGPHGTSETTAFSYPVYKLLRHQNHEFQDLFAVKDLGSYNRITATIDGHAEAVTGQLVSGNFFQVLGVDTAIGRPIQPSDDDVPGRGAVAVISDGLWARSFGRSPAVIGRTIRLNAAPVTIIGVNRPGFTGAASVQASPDIFLPFSTQPVILPQGKEFLLDDKSLWWVQVMGRAKDDVADATAFAALSVSFDQAVKATMPGSKDKSYPSLALLSGSRGLNSPSRDFGTQIYVLLTLVGLVLLLACANVANLLLARSSARQREISVRTALGASRGRILRQVFTESLLLSLLGGIAGFSLAYLGRNLIPQLLSNSWQTPQFHGRFDWRIFLFTGGITLVSGLIFGLAPAVQSTRSSVNSALKDNPTTATGRRRGFAGKAIVVCQLALSMLLVVGAGLFLRTLVKLNHVDPGFHPDNLLLFHLQPPEARYPPAKAIIVEHQIEERLRTLPEMDSVTLSAEPLLAHNLIDENFGPDGSTLIGRENRSVDVNLVGEAFLATMGIPLLSGRDIDEHDTETSPKVAVVNQTLARKFFPKGNPSGGKLNDEHLQIVGISADAKYDDLRQEALPTIYVPYRQAKNEGEGVTYELRLKTSPEGVLPSVRNAVASIDRDLPLLDIRTQTQQIDALLSQERLFAALSGAFGLLALVLACIGIYGIMAYTVARRTNEIGIRMALGAQAGQVLRMVLSEASWLAGLGILLGAAGALSRGRFLASLLYGLKPTDAGTLAGSALLLMTTAIAAGLIPAWRASRVQPMNALRHE
jgi:predicted permease